MFSLRFSLNMFLVNNIQSRGIFTTSYLMAEPLKKKKRIDPQVLKRREEKKIRKLEREIQRLENTPKQLKPIIELQLAPQVIKELSQRQRPVVECEANEEYQRLAKLWSIYKCEQQLSHLRSIKLMIKSQEIALDVLKKMSSQHYSSAISIDPNLIAFKMSSVKKETPKVDQYVAPDGRKADITKQWSM